MQTSFLIVLVAYTSKVVRVTRKVRSSKFAWKFLISFRLLAVRRKLHNGSVDHVSKAEASILITIISSVLV